MFSTITQKDDYGCGPVAVYNTLVLLGIKPPSLRKLYKLSGVDKQEGLNLNKLRDCLKKFNITLKRVDKKRPNKLYIALDGPYWDELGKFLHYTVVQNKDVYNYYDGIRCYKKVQKKLKQPTYYEVISES